MQTQQNTGRRVSALERSNKGNALTGPIIVDPVALQEARDLLDATRASDLPPVVWSNQNKTSGFVRVSQGDDQAPYKFTGLLLPFQFDTTDRNTGKLVTRLRNRILIVGKKSHEWFLPFCGEIFDDGENMRLRVRVDTLYEERLAFIIPAARTPSHAKAEWTVALATYKSRYPARYSQYSPADLSRAIYERFVRTMGGSITHFTLVDNGAIAVDTTQQIWHLTNGANIEQFSGDLKYHDVILDSNIDLCVKRRQLSTLEELNKLLENSVASDTLLRT